jgi:hypothetical protein
MTATAEKVEAPVQSPPAPSAVATIPEASLPVVPADLSPSALIYAGIQAGLTAETMEKLMALQERVEARNAAKAFAKAFAAFQAECPLIRRTSTAKITTKGGSAYSYTYAELDEIAIIAGPYLDKNDFSYSWDRRVSDKGTLTSVCTLYHIEGHSRSSSFELPVESASAMSPQQKYAAASTFADRKSLSAVLGLVTTDRDFDGAAAIDPTPITETQLFELEDMIEDAGADRARFLKFIGVEKLSELKAVHFNEAIGALKQKKGRE